MRTNHAAAIAAACFVLRNGTANQGRCSKKYSHPIFFISLSSPALSQLDGRRAITLLKYYIGIIPITAQHILAHALPVFFDSASPPRPKSSGSSCTIIARPIIERLDAGSVDNP